MVDGTEKNERKAFEYVEKSANQGFLYAKSQLAAVGKHNYARNSLAIMFENGEGTEKDLEKAFFCFIKQQKMIAVIAQCNVAKTGHISAIFQLGYCYVNGIGTEINREKGFEMYNKAAEDVNVHNYFGKNDKETINNLNHIIYLYHKAAEDDNNFALYKLGECYELGKGHCYEKGFGTDMNKVKAFEFYKIAATGGNVDAQRSLADLYEHGEGTDKNVENAIYWYERAIENGYLDVKENLNILLKQQNN
ncbi:unnamed protein product [Rhizophagus irregularis]|nr:unnamed protein product [Rhizophagus irregularis]